MWSICLSSHCDAWVLGWSTRVEPTNHRCQCDGTPSTTATQQSHRPSAWPSRVNRLFCEISLSLPSQPAVSVIIPTLDSESTITAALDSVFHEQDVDLEVLIVDDGSRDRTWEVVSSRGDSRIRWLSTGARRSGSGVARNVALEAVRGKWIALLDSDDEWAPMRLERLMDAGDRFGCGVVADDMLIRAPSGSANSDSTLLPRRGVHLHHEFCQFGILELIRFDLGLLMPIFRSSMVTDHGVRYPSYQCSTPDFSLLFDLISIEGRGILVNDATYFYLKRPGSESRTRPEFWLDVVRMTADIMGRESAKDPEVEAALGMRLRMAMAKYRYMKAREAWSERAFTRCISHLSRDPRAAALAVKALNRRLVLQRSVAGGHP